MIDWVLKLFKLKRIYVCKWGEYESRYDSLDCHAMRPIHKDMSVAPPWAVTRIVKTK